MDVHGAACVFRYSFPVVPLSYLQRGSIDGNRIQLGVPVGAGGETGLACAAPCNVAPYTARSSSRRSFSVSFGAAVPASQCCGCGDTRAQGRQSDPPPRRSQAQGRKCLEARAVVGGGATVLHGVKPTRGGWLTGVAASQKHLEMLDVRQPCFLTPRRLCCLFTWGL